MFRFKTKVEYVEAVRNPPADEDVQITKAHPAWLLQGITSGTLIALGDGRLRINNGLMVEPGEWLVRRADGMFRIVDDKRFRAEFEEADTH